MVGTVHTLDRSRAAVFPGYISVSFLVLEVLEYIPLIFHIRGSEEVSSVIPSGKRGIRIEY